MFGKDFYNNIFNDIIEHKIRPFSKVLAIVQEGNTFSTLVIGKNIHFEILNTNVVSSYKNNNYDYILFQDFNIFKKFNNDTKIKLKNDGKIMILTNIIATYNQYYYHPLSYIFNFFNEQIYLTDFSNNLRSEYGYKLIDLYRIFSYDKIPTFPIEFFLVTLENI
jgi:hypothetical protein